MNNQTESISQEGFSLIEALVVMAIIAILGALATPFFGGFLENRDLKSAARSLAGDIFELKERAIGEDRLYQIAFNVGANNYVMTQCNDTALPCNGTVIATKSPKAFRNSISINALNPVGGTVIQIQPRGTINPPGNANETVTLVNGRGSRATITISLTGRASVDWTGTMQ